MSKIRILSDDIRNKIAAGEVIERPASVIKELIENSLDAQSFHIVIESEKAGKRLLKVSDDGTGMDCDDVMLSVERYATSKITTDSELSRILTFGFRGEALASIAAVSKITICTGLSTGIGTCIEVHGGERRSVRECATTGTTIEIRELFFNTPARWKFMKSEMTENHHIIDMVTRLSLSSPGVAFTLKIDGLVVLDLPRAGSHHERLHQVFGGDFVKNLFFMSSKLLNMEFMLFAAHPRLARKTRSGQYMFVNARPVRDISTQQAVCRGYSDSIDHDRNPVFFLFLNLDPVLFDINVHPAKREIKFANPKEITGVVYKMTYNAIRSKSDLSESESSRVPLNQPESEINSEPRTMASSHFQGDHLHIAEKTEKYDGKLIFISAGDTFAATSTKDGVLLFDYHAAHERINYELLLKRTGINSRNILFPHRIHLPPHESSVILDNIGLLQEFGFDFEDFGHGDILIRRLPELIGESDPTPVFSDLVQAITSLDDTGKERESPDFLEKKRRELAAKLACHASIRGKEMPTDHELRELLENLDKTENPDNCPHGRPTRIFLTVKELRKMFKKR